MGLAALAMALRPPPACPLPRAARSGDRVPAMSVPLVRRQLVARRGARSLACWNRARAPARDLALKAILAGAEGRLTGYIDRSGADVIVAQEGVRTMHMTESALPEQAALAIAIVPGRGAGDPIVYVPTMLERGDSARSST